MRSKWNICRLNECLKIINGKNQALLLLRCFWKKERDLVKQVNDEIIERVVGQQILYFPIDIETTNYHPLYGEAIEKPFFRR